VVSRSLHIEINSTFAGAKTSVQAARTRPSSSSPSGRATLVVTLNSAIGIVSRETRCRCALRAKDPATCIFDVAAAATGNDQGIPTCRRTGRKL